MCLHRLHPRPIICHLTKDFIYLFILQMSHNKTRITFKERHKKNAKKNAKAYRIILGCDTPSSKPSPLLHFTLDPLKHKLDARTRADKSPALTNAYISAYDFSHLAAMLVAMCFKKCSASL